jgi:hypothetical protein
MHKDVTSCAQAHCTKLGLASRDIVWETTRVEFKPNMGFPYTVNTLYMIYTPYSHM